MRIGIVCPYSYSRPGGVQEHVWGLGEYLTSRGHAVEVLAPGALTPGARERPQPRFTSAGAAVPVAWNGSVARISYGPRPALAARRWLARGFDVVHVHEPLTPSLSWHVLGAASVPVVATAHTAQADRRWHVAGGRLGRARLGRLAATVAVSEVAADLATSYLQQRPRIIPNAIWTTDFCSPPPASPWRGGSRPRLTFLGRDEPRKGLDVLLRAIPAIVAGADVDVVVAGASGRCLPAPCRALDVRDDAARARLLAGTDVLVSPATGGESFGIVLVEAMAAGCQVVASDLPAFTAVLADAGTTFPVGDAAALAGAVLATLAAPAPAGVLRDRAGHYDWTRVGPELEELYAAHA